jgi:predicted MFS family arabinose efflux permease
VDDPAVAGRPPLTFGQVTRVREFRWLWLADVQSLLGDQLARVALSVLVFERTHSNVLTAGVYALTFIPALIGSFLLGPLADRMPRRTLLVGGDLIRAALIGLMALLGAPIWLLCVLLVVAVVIGSPWKAAETALVGDILAGEGYVLGTGLRFATSQGSQLVGFAVGGAAVAAIGPRWALAINAITFAVSALVIRLGVRSRPPAHQADVLSGEEPSPARSWLAGIAMVADSKKLRALLGLSWLAGLFVVPEGLAAPYAASIGGGAKTIGLLLAALPAGTLIGSLLLARFVKGSRRTSLVGPLAVIAGLPLVACVLRPGLTLTIVLWMATGACVSYQVQIIAEYVAAIPNRARGQGVGVLTSGLLAIQGVGLLAAGLVSQVLSTTTTIASCGGLAIVLAIPLALGRRRHGAHAMSSPARRDQPNTWSPTVFGATPQVRRGNLPKASRVGPARTEPFDPDIRSVHAE